MFPVVKSSRGNTPSLSQRRPKDTSMNWHVLLGAKIADVPTQRKGSGHQNARLSEFDELQGDMILEVPCKR